MNSKDSDSSVALPETFPFPYEKPYDIQLNFMRALYKTLELGKIGIFESPTGTVIFSIKRLIKKSNQNNEGKKFEYNLWSYEMAQR